MIRCDIVKVDSELQNKYDDHFASGGGVTIKYTTYNSQILKILGTSSTMNLSRSLTYLTRIFVSSLKTIQLETLKNFGTKITTPFITPYEIKIQVRLLMPSV